MPTYTLKNTDTGEVWDEFFKTNSLKEQYLSDNPKTVQTFRSGKTPAIGESIRMRNTRKHSPEMREVLNKVRETPGSTIDTGNITEV